MEIVGMTSLRAYVVNARKSWPIRRAESEKGGGRMSAMWPGAGVCGMRGATRPAHLRLAVLAPRRPGPPYGRREFQARLLRPALDFSEAGCFKQTHPRRTFPRWLVFHAGQNRRGHKWETKALPEFHRGLVKLFFEGGAELVAVFGDYGINQGDGLRPSANRTFGPSGAGGATALELCGMAHGWPVSETPENADCACS